MMHKSVNKWTIWNKVKIVEKTFEKSLASAHHRISKKTVQTDQQLTEFGNS